MKRALFWGSGALLAYTYLGFPALVLLRARLRPRPYLTDDIEPTVTVVVAAHNEQDVIEEKVANLLELDYPADRLEIVVASDGSDDRTVELAQRHGNQRIHVIDLPRVGKAGALNRAVALAHGEIVVFSDAHSMFVREAVRELVRPFADPAVGGVAGDRIYSASHDGVSHDGDASVLGERRYWDFDRVMKTAQSRAGSVSGASGAIHAVRRTLLDEIRGDVNDDLFISLRVVDKGYRLVFAPGAVAYEAVVPSAAETFSRRVRVMVRGFRCVGVVRGVLDVRRHGFFSVQLFSHKVLLRVAAFPLAALAVTSVLLARRGGVYRAAAVGQTAFYALGATGIAFAHKPWSRSKVLALPAYFCLVNAASVVAVWHLVRRRPFERWAPGRRADTK